MLKNSGGKRANAGRKRNKTPTRQVSIRFPISLIIRLEILTGKPFDKWLKQKANEYCNG